MMPERPLSAVSILVCTNEFVRAYEASLTRFAAVLLLLLLLLDVVPLDILGDRRGTFKPPPPGLLEE
jgi:hypothetical protein